MIQILNCLICHHEFDWNAHKNCPNCNWQVVDFIGDEDHMANIHLRPEREAWANKNNYKIEDYSYKGYVPALLKAMKSRCVKINEIVYDQGFIPNFERDPFETPDEFNLRLKQQPAFLGIAHLDAKKYDVRQERFDLTLEWHSADYMPMVFKLLDSQASYYLNVNRDQAKSLFQNSAKRMIFGSFQLEKPELNDDIIFSNTPVLVGDDAVFELKSNQEFKQNQSKNKKRISVVVPRRLGFDLSIQKWNVKIGDYVEENSIISELLQSNTDTLINLNAGRKGKFIKILKTKLSIVNGGDVIAEIEVDE